MVIVVLQVGDGDMVNILFEVFLVLYCEGVDDVVVVYFLDKLLFYVIVVCKDVMLDDMVGKIFGIGQLGSLDQILFMVVLVVKGVSIEVQ